MKYTIIGAGIGGLTTALAFEQKGIDYEIYERATTLSEVGAGIWMAPNPLQVFESLGILEEVKAEGNSIDRISLTKKDLSILSDSSQDKVKQLFGYSTIAIHRARLQKLLFDKIPQEKIHLGKSFEAFEELHDGKINVTFQDGSTALSDYLIGADGIHSGVRKQLFPNSKTRYSGQTCWRGLSSFQLPPEHEHRGMELWGNGVRLGISRISDKEVYWFAVATAEAGQKEDQDTVQQKLLGMYNDFHPMVKELIKNTQKDKILRNDISDLVRLEKWHHNNICLIGDAGHATTPNMGQGAAQAIEDAYYLSNLIAANPDKNIFAEFEQKRRKKVDMIVNQSWSTGQMAHWKRGRGFRNLLVKILPSSILEKKLMQVYTLEKQ